MSQAAYVKIIKVGADVVEWSFASFTEQAEDLDVTTGKANGGYKQHLAGLLDAPAQMTIEYTPADPAFVALKAALRARTTVVLQYLPDGTSGVQATMAVLSMNQSGDVGGKEQVEVSMVPTSAVTDV